MSLVSPPPVPVSNKNLRCAQPYVIDFKQLQVATTHGVFDQSLFHALKEAAPTGLLHVVNHGLDPVLFQRLAAITYTYMMTTTVEEKDAVSCVNGTGSFEGYKPRTSEERDKGFLPGIEEYKYDYRTTGMILRPKIFRDNEDFISKILDFYHRELTPRLLALIEAFCGLQPGYLNRLHEKSSDVAHFLLYHSKWYRDVKRKRAAYAGHTDIGSLTYFYANPVTSVQVYGYHGWEYVAYIPNSIVVNMGDSMQFLTKGLMNATLYRVIRPASDQDDAVRTALVYYVHPNPAVMSACVRGIQELRAKYTKEHRISPGCAINGLGVNRVISSISATSDDRYLSVVDPKAWEASRRGEMIASPKRFCVNFENLTVRKV